jgi:hypothetical protein
VRYQAALRPEETAALCVGEGLRVNVIQQNRAFRRRWNRAIVQDSYLFGVVDRRGPFTDSGSLSSCTGIAVAKNGPGIPSELDFESPFPEKDEAQ